MSKFVLIAAAFTAGASVALSLKAAYSPRTPTTAPRAASTFSYETTAATASTSSAATTARDGPQRCRTFTPARSMRRRPRRERRRAAIPWFEAWEEPATPRCDDEEEALVNAAAVMGFSYAFEGFPTC